MDYNNKDSGPNQRRSDVGQRVYWEPLPSDILDAVFGSDALKYKALKNYAVMTGSRSWNEDNRGFSYFGSSDNKIYLLVTRREHRKQLRDKFTLYTLLSSAANEKSLETGEAILNLQKLFMEEFSSLVTLSTVIGYTGNSAKFIEDHWGQDGKLPNRIFEGNVGTDSGSKAGVNIYSIATSENKPLNVNLPGYQTASRRAAKARVSNEQI
jgi:hypothetical protein